MWVENNGHRALWVPSQGFYPVFISPDQNFLGFQNKQSGDIILYDHRKKRARLLVNQSENDNNIIAVSFSAMNALLALAFSDGSIYIHDLINDIQDDTRQPILVVNLKKMHHNLTFYNIVMHFEGLFNNLTVIYNQPQLKPDGESYDRLLVRESYSIDSSIDYN